MFVSKALLDFTVCQAACSIFHIFMHSKYVLRKTEHSWLFIRVLFRGCFSSEAVCNIQNSEFIFFSYTNLFLEHDISLSLWKCNYLLIYYQLIIQDRLSALYWHRKAIDHECVMSICRLMMKAGKQTHQCEAKWWRTFILFRNVWLISPYPYPYLSTCNK